MAAQPSPGGANFNSTSSQAKSIVLNNPRSIAECASVRAVGRKLRFPGIWRRVPPSPPRGFHSSPVCTQAADFPRQSPDREPQKRGVPAWKYRLVYPQRKMRNHCDRRTTHSLGTRALVGTSSAQDPFTSSRLTSRRACPAKPSDQCSASAYPASDRYLGTRHCCWTAAPCSPANAESHLVGTCPSSVIVAHDGAPPLLQIAV